MIRHFMGLASFAHFLEAQTDIMVPVGEIGIGAIGDVLEKEVKGMYGDHRLPDLADATKADREKKGFTPDDPLLRDGSLLRDSVERKRGADFVSVGSSEPAAAASEYGFVNARTGRFVPPRAAFREGLRDTIPKAIEITEEIVGIQLGVTPVSARITELSRIPEE